ncbi:hypothetical protein [Dehalobacter restrictus]|uniref:Uncharacterized protein n=1 Tax=Dehalobacter restrictus TaxID=55583 RepID=A0A857DID9_9FIRM|nr:hypothetical protein [Dehalobacter restrictus]QGZ99985.1 hypothetical protein GQ588_04650 [Dehalobacter restrictus]
MFNDIYYISTVMLYRPITTKTAHSRIATRATVTGGFIGWWVLCWVVG